MVRFVIKEIEWDEENSNAKKSLKQLEEWFLREFEKEEGIDLLKEQRFEIEFKVKFTPEQKNTITALAHYYAAKDWRRRFAGTRTVEKHEGDQEYYSAMKYHYQESAKKGDHDAMVELAELLLQEAEALGSEVARKTLDAVETRPNTARTTRDTSRVGSRAASRGASRASSPKPDNSSEISRLLKEAEDWLAEASEGGHLGVDHILEKLRGVKELGASSLIDSVIGAFNTLEQHEDKGGPPSKKAKHDSTCAEVKKSSAFLQAE